MQNPKPEVWLRGPIPEIPALLQPAAHALLQSCEEIERYLIDFPQDKLWTKVAGRASVGFHLQHITGVLDRMMSYARAESLSEEQFSYLSKEGQADEGRTVIQLVSAFQEKTQEALSLFKTLDEDTLREVRSVGRKKLPSTTLGLLFHAAEHSQRHVGQLLVTKSVLIPPKH
ncbi:DinB family protein [Zobellia galactanivorans]|uniref:DinB family protein n=1 Tax=Zobellia galactanivorans (strain DSM 12802 / CCUG 47099 / CIP 106680 / NCIMB 13871 / Dsij) TaxID=63186 RepID=UPI0026E17C3B|nr:DinB family protein [Zobellia galactanivorans]MDO6810206.1 DinB family protein [Zobellia galactanivorans]